MALEVGAVRGNRLTIAEHWALGAELKAMHRRLVHLAVDLPNRYGKTSKLANRLDAVDRAMSRLRSELDEHLARDHPAQFDPGIYYGEEPRPPLSGDDAVDRAVRRLEGRR